MDQLLQDRTSITIAHRLSTVRNADLIVVLDAGTIVERGTHDELITRRGLYHYLVARQLHL
jgi:ABC-type multidrug transport system fused ATPase/permease subunit